uniref:DnaJ domain protein n=1 Tax=Mimivirus LCMiAC01 TaxID=2506608 RepID=A0A481YYM0_9VIRU|nr:MAG: DnaJ domain protein [Mimivirus LCMiAC01]
MTTVNLYDVLKLSSDCSQSDIKKQYRILAKKYHPDRKKHGDRDFFELITEAYNVLSDPHTRADYDKIYNDSMNTLHDHLSRKEEFDNYESSRKTDVTHLSKEESKKIFEKESKEMDRRHNFHRENLNNVLDSSHTDRFYDDLRIAREQDDIENMHNKIFDDGRFNLSQFNEAWDITHKSKGKLIPHTGNPNPWNQIIGGSYSSINNNNLYEESDNIDTETMNCMDYAPIAQNNQSHSKILTKNDVEQLKGALYTHGHDAKDDNYIKDFNQRVRELKAKQNEYNNMEFGDYKKDDFGGYGITEGIKDQLSLTYTNDTLDKDELDRKYQKLLESRKT